MSTAEIKLAALEIGDSIWGAAKSAGNAVAGGAQWVGGALAGEFNTKATVGQIIVDAVISMFPVAGEVTAARDATAIIIRMNESEEAANSTWEWVALVLCLLAVVPVIGGVLKGVGRLVIRAVSKSEDLVKLGAEILSFLRKMGYGDAHKWLKELDFAKYQGQVMGAFSQMIGYIGGACSFIIKNMNKALPASVLASLQAMPVKLAKVQGLASRMIPQAIKELNVNLDKVRKVLLDGSYIAPITVAGKESKVAVAEARLAEKVAVERFTSNGHTAAPASHWIAKAGWPMFKEQRGIDAIATFSKRAPINAHTVLPGKPLARVVDIADIRKSGAFWSESLPVSGTAWRSDCAVKTGWSKNGGVIEVTAVPTRVELVKKGIKNIPEDWAGLRVWRGKIAEQTDDASRLLLPGGDIQLFIDWTHPHNKVIADWIKTLPVRLTGWKDVNLVATSKPAITAAEALGVNERSIKIRREGYVARSAATGGKQANNDE